MIHELACIGTRKVELLRLALAHPLGFYDAAVAFGPIKTAARLRAIEGAEVQRVRASADDSPNVWAVPDAVASYDSLLSDLVARLARGELVAEAVEILENGEPAVGPSKPRGAVSLKTLTDGELEKLSEIERADLKARSDRGDLDNLTNDELVRLDENLTAELLACINRGESVGDDSNVLEYTEIVGPPDWQPVESTAWAGAEWRRSASPDMFRSPVSVLLTDMRVLRRVEVRTGFHNGALVDWTETDDALPQLVSPALWQVLADMRQAFADVGGPEALPDIARTAARYAGGTLILMPQEHALIELHDAIARVESLLWGVVHGVLLAGTVRARSPVEVGSGAWQEWQPEKWRLYRFEVTGNLDSPGRIKIVSHDQQPDGTLRRLPARYFQFSSKTGCSSPSKPHNALMQIGPSTGRSGGLSLYDEADKTLVAEMHEAMKSGCRSIWAATDLVVARAAGGGLPESKRKRLMRRYKDAGLGDTAVQNGSDITRLNRSERA